MAETIKIGGELESTATGNVVAVASAIKDKVKNKYQGEINAETDASLADRYTKAETYNKTELNNMITTPNQQYVSVTANSQTTAVTDILPATGAANTVYRVGNWDSSQFDASVYSEYAWNGSSYVHLSTKTKIGEVFDISAYHATGGTLATYANLSAALDSNNGGGVPQSLQKGGMSVKFVQSSDNKYVQYRLMADEWSANVEDWAFYGNDVYVENPEFVRVVLDNESKILEATRVDGTKLLPAGVEINDKIDFDGNETTIIENPEFVEVKLDGAGHILWGIQKDGNVYFGAGIPQQVVDYINEKIAELSLDEYEDIVVFLNDLEKGDKTLQDLLNEKVDKEEGKSLIDAEYASSQSVIENPEFIEVTIDREDKVLEGIQKNGTKVISGDIKVLGNMEVSGVSYKVIENPEYLAAWVDAENKVIFGLKVNGKTYVGDADFLNEIKNNQEVINEIKSYLASFDNLDIDALSSITAVVNPKYIEAKTDSEGKLLAGRTPDGAAFENVGFSTPKVSIDGNTIENIEDPEGRSEITTDSEGKIISYRDSGGVKHEEVGIETNHLGLSDVGLTDLEKDLKEHGFLASVGDWSDAKELHIAEPYCARVNFTGISDIPQAKGVNLHGYMQFWDMNGNYFKKEVIMNAQGSSSMGHPKKNIAIDICNNNGWDDDDTFKLQIGNWVPQDSFHLKAFFNDPFRGLCPVAYKWYDMIVKTRGEIDDYVWKRSLIDMSSITSTSNGSSTAKDTEAQYNDGARCFPDGFPCIVYLNGEFYGIYSWQLKKHRDNYHMDKKNTKHIHLDGIINGPFLFDGNIDWTRFEVRNPKDLICMDGSKYDGDNPTELIDSTSPAYDGSNSKHVNTAKVKQYIKNMVTMKQNIDSAYAVYQASEKTPQDIATFKAVFETYFDIQNLTDYLIFSDVSNNYDGFNKNWQWITYDGVKWFIGVYDCDGVFGGYYELNDYIVPPLTQHIIQEAQSVTAIGTTFMITPFYDLYKEELETRYSELRKKSIIDKDVIMSIMINWLNRIGNKETFKKEWAKWPSFIKNDSIHRMYKWVVESINNMDIVYHYNQN